MPDPPVSDWNQRAIALLAALAIAIAAGAIYSNSFAGAFVLDDRQWIIDNPFIRSFSSAWSAAVSPPGSTVDGRPVVSMTLALNYQFGKTDVLGYHALNLAIHILAAWTLFGVVRRSVLLPALRGQFGKVATPLALAVALLWAVHPLQTQAVTYVIQRTESLMGLFYLLTLYCVIRGATSGVSPLKSQASSLTPAALAWYCGATLCCLLGMATKEVMVTAPIVVLLYDRTFLAGSFRRALEERWALYLTLAATWGVIAWLLIATHFHGGTTGFGVRGFTSWSYLTTQPSVIARYLRLVFWPTGQCLDYDWPPAESPGEIIPAALLIVGLLGLTVWALVKRPALGFLGAAFFLILAPTSSFVPIKDAAFEHRMYLSLAAVVTLAVLTVWTFCDRRFANQSLSALLLVAVTVGLGSATVRRNEVYRSDLSVWQDVLKRSPNNLRALDNAAMCLLEREQPNEALVYLNRALAINPGQVEAWIALGQARMLQKDSLAARDAWNEALKYDSDNPTVLNNIGYLSIDSNPDEAIRYFRKALAFSHDYYPNAHHNLGLALERQGNLDGAIREYHIALWQNPDHPEAKRDLKKALIERQTRAPARTNSPPK